MLRGVVLALAACGAPATSQPVAPAPAQPTVPTRAPAAITCGDAGVVLRGYVEDAKRAGPVKEAAIATACLLDRWSPEVLACIGGDGSPAACIGKLDGRQRAGYTKAIEAWNAEFGDGR
jgi:hypothetical protein